VTTGGGKKEVGGFSRFPSFFFVEEACEARRTATRTDEKNEKSENWRKCSSHLYVDAFTLYKIAVAPSFSES
jgi:hypothetical protein